jgi:hypothetical protein
MIEKASLSHHGLKLFKILSQDLNIAQLKQNCSLKFIINAINKWNEQKLTKTGKNLQHDTVRSGVSAVLNHLIFLGFSDKQLGNERQRSVVIKTIVKTLLNRADMEFGTEKSFPIHHSSILNECRNILLKIKFKLKTPFSIVEVKEVNRDALDAAKVMFQFFSFMRPSETYFTSLKQIKNNFIEKEFTINFDGTEQKFKAIVSFSNVHRHKNLNRARTKFAAFILATKTNHQDKFKPTLLGLAVGILFCKTKQLANLFDTEWDSIMPPAISKQGELTPAKQSEMKNSLKTIYKLAGRSINISRFGPYMTRRTSFSTLAFYKVDASQITKAADWKSDQILSFYTRANLFSSHKNLAELHPEVVTLIVLQSRAYQIHEISDTKKLELPKCFLQKLDHEQYDSDEDTEIGAKLD